MNRLGRFFRQLIQGENKVSDTQSHLDADVAALAASLASIEAEIADLKAAHAPAVDFTGLDNAVATAKGLVPAPVAPPAPPAPAPAPLELPTALADATVGTAYSATLSATGGTPPYTWEVAGLPDGLTAASGGTITGTPTTFGIHSATLTVTDSAGVSATGAATIAVSQAAPPAEPAPTAAPAAPVEPAAAPEPAPAPEVAPPPTDQPPAA